jgi:hypothetical protein
MKERQKGKGRKRSGSMQPGKGCRFFRIIAVFRPEHTARSSVVIDAALFPVGSQDVLEHPFEIFEFLVDVFFSALGKAI